jgi:hypothetical protein
MESVFSCSFFHAVSFQEIRLWNSVSISYFLYWGHIPPQSNLKLKKLILYISWKFKILYQAAEIPCFHFTFRSLDLAINSHPVSVEYVNALHPQGRLLCYSIHFMIWYNCMKEYKFFLQRMFLFGSAGGRFYSNFRGLFSESLCYKHHS